MTRADETIPAAWTDVLAERRRQVEAEGWTSDNDDFYVQGEIALAAATYAIAAAWDDEDRKPFQERRFGSMFIRGLWPWSKEWWKPTDRRRDLVKAGALILAEIARLDRAALIAREEAEHGR